MLKFFYSCLWPLNDMMLSVLKKIIEVQIPVIPQKIKRLLP